jgi:hypothetical protein
LPLSFVVVVVVVGHCEGALSPVAIQKLILFLSFPSYSFTPERQNIFIRERPLTLPSPSRGEGMVCGIGSLFERQTFISREGRPRGVAPTVRLFVW